MVHCKRHEHLYQKIEWNVIRSDDFSTDRVGTSRIILGSKVILCTLSMFSHPRLAYTGITRIVPVETVIVDEASQIELGDYLPLWSLHGKKMKKMVFIGDDKQREFVRSHRVRVLTKSLGVFRATVIVAPYGQDDLGDLQSIFEVPHLRGRAVFLNTQCTFHLLSYFHAFNSCDRTDRMPGAIGGFISHHMYDGKLQTVHSNAGKIACRFVDVRDGKEEKSGNSWKVRQPHLHGRH